MISTFCFQFLPFTSARPTHREISPVGFVSVSMFCFSSFLISGFKNAVCSFPKQTLFPHSLIPTPSPQITQKQLISTHSPPTKQRLNSRLHRRRVIPGEAHDIYSLSLLYSVNIPFQIPSTSRFQPTMLSALCPPLNLLFSSLRFSLPSSPRPMPPPSASPDPVLHEFRFFRVYQSGRVEKLHPPTETVPPSSDTVPVLSKDVVVSSDPPVSARLFLPAGADPTQRLPLLFYVHGGGFTFESAFSPETHGYVSSLASRARCVAVSIEYRLAPAVPIPACYDDAWAAFRWVMAHREGNGPEEWIALYADLGRVFVAGDSAGGNISHDLAVRIGESGLRVEGVVLSHPFFGGTEDDAMWMYMCPENDGLNDRRLRPKAEDLSRVGCRRMLVFVAGKDHLRGGGERYVEELRKSGWEGEVELVVSEGEDHCFHLKDLGCKKAVILADKIVSFINNGN